MPQNGEENEYKKENTCYDNWSGLNSGTYIGFIYTDNGKSAMTDEIQDALKGTAAATLAAYDQNTGDYIQASNGDIWKGSYNISKSESLVDGIKENTGMDVTFFYGSQRIMTSARMGMVTDCLVLLPEKLLLKMSLIKAGVISAKMYHLTGHLTMDILHLYTRMEAVLIS